MCMLYTDALFWSMCTLCTEALFWSICMLCTEALFWNLVYIDGNTFMWELPKYRKTITAEAPIILVNTQLWWYFIKYFTLYISITQIYLVSLIVQHTQWWRGFAISKSDCSWLQFFIMSFIIFYSAIPGCIRNRCDPFFSPLHYVPFRD